MARSRELRVEVVADTKGYARAMDRAGHHTDDLDNKMSRFQSTATAAFKGAAVAAGAFAGAGLVASVKAAIDAEKSQKSLDAQLKAVGSTLRTNSKVIQDVIQKHSQLAAIDDEDLQAAFGNIVRATGNVDKSLKLVGLAADIARGKHLEVAKAAEIVGKVAGGNVGILSRYGFVMKDGATATEALGLLQKRFAGQAEAYGKTTEGSYQRVRVSLENVGEKIGAKLLPHLVKAAEWLNRFITQMERGKGAGGTFARIVNEIVVSFAHFGRSLGAAIRDVRAFGRVCANVAKAVAGFFSATFNAIEKAFGDTMSTILRGFAKIFDLASHLPGKVGDKFDVLQSAAEDAADSVDKLGEKLKVASDVDFSSTISQVRELKREAPGGSVGSLGRGRPRRNRGGGFNLGPAMLSPGEMGITPGGGAFVVPGARVAADTVPALVPPGTAILTDSGQSMLAAGASIPEAVARQAPHFGKGGWPNNKTYNRQMMEGVWVAGGGAIDKAHKMASIAWSESRWRPWATNPSDGGKGLWQITPAQPGSGDALTNAKQAVAKMRAAVSYGWSPFQPWDASSSVWGQRDSSPGAKSTHSHAFLRSIKRGGGPSRGTSTVTTPAAISHPLLGDMLGPLMDDALMGGIEAGMARTGRRGLLSATLNDILPDAGDRATRSRVSAGAARRRSTQGGVGSGTFSKAVAEARKLDAANLPYVWGGGHNDPSTAAMGGYDCSGAVSRVMQQAGFDFPTDVSGGMMDYGVPGAGKKISIFANPGHVFMRLGNSYFGTSRSNPGGGPGFMGTSYSTAGFTARHPPGYRRGGIAGFRPGGYTEDMPGWGHRFGSYRDFGGGRGPWRTRDLGGKRKLSLQQVLRLLGRDGIGSPKADSLIRQLAGRMSATTLGQLLRARKNIRTQIRDMAAHGFTGPERIRTRRLRGGLSLIEDQLGRPIGGAIGASDRAQELISRAESRLPDELTVAGIDPDSAEGIAARKSLAGSSLTTLAARRAALVKALRRAKKTKNRTAIAAARAELNEVDDQMLGLRASIVDLDKTMQESVIASQEALAEQVKALKESIDEQNRIYNSSTAVTARQLQLALSDMVSGQIGGYVGERARSSGDGVTGARY